MVYKTNEILRLLQKQNEQQEINTQHITTYNGELYCKIYSCINKSITQMKTCSSHAHGSLIVSIN